MKDTASKLFSTLFLPVLALLMMFVITKKTDFYTFWYFDYDGYAHYQQVMLMFDGLKTLNPIKLFSFNLNYGAPYFFVCLLASLPGLILNNDALFLVGPRCVAAAAALFTVWFLFKSFCLYMKPKFAFISILPLVLMPGFWIKIQYFRPDWVLTGLTLGCAYFLLKDKLLYRSSFWKGIVFFGLALSTKTQTVFFLPILGLAPIMPALLNPNWINIKSSAWRLLKSVGLVSSIFFVLNPHTLHPIGMYGFTRRFGIELARMSETKQNFIMHKIMLINEFIFPSTLFIALVSLSAVLVWWCIKEKKHQELIPILCGGLIATGYMMFISTKFNWNFMIAPCVLLLFGIIYLRYNLPDKQLILILALVSIAMFPKAVSTFTFYAGNEPDNTNAAIVKHNDDLVLPLLKGKITSDMHIGCSQQILFHYNELGLKNNQVHPIFGLGWWHFRQDAHDERWGTVRRLEKKLNMPYGSVKPFTEKKALIIAKVQVIRSQDLEDALFNNETEFQLIGENDKAYVFLHKSLL